LKQRDTGKATSKAVNKQVTEQSRQVEEAEGRLHNRDTDNTADMSKELHQLHLDTCGQ
jgi:hypothetical protein